MNELVIDLENKRFAEIPAEGPRPESPAAQEEHRADVRRLALARLKIRAAAGDETLADLLTVMGLASE
jgi:hypothetical protein